MPKPSSKKTSKKPIVVDDLPGGDTSKVKGGDGALIAGVARPMTPAIKVATPKVVATVPAMNNKLTP